ncbi:MAG TPA: 3-dehydroquinate synthase II [Desulfobacteraceae bacterium]|nr:3-dehydroquinate synthase II [Desulfobacteraceae bacterium]
MRQLWVKADPWNKDMVTAALENGADAVIVPPENVNDARSLGRIIVVSPGGDIIPGEDVVEMEIGSADDEEAIVAESKRRRVIVKTTDWTVIPLENLVARSENIFVEVENPEEARTACGVLEKGVAGVVVKTLDPAAAGRMVRNLKEAAEPFTLEELSICRITSLGMGDRVCVDTCTLMSEGEGILVGNSSSMLFLVQAESLENPYVAPRPFRVNAGAVHSYTLAAAGTKYLSELRSGDEVQVVSSEGSALTAVVGRAKVERRPLLLVEAEGRFGKSGVILQNAETVRLLKPGGDALSVAALAVGDRVLGRLEEGGRHFGMSITERISEK